MKKTYIEPKNTVVRIKLETMILAQSAPDYKPENTTDAESGNLSRECISAPDAWDEW